MVWPRPRKCGQVAASRCGRPWRHLPEFFQRSSAGQVGHLDPPEARPGPAWPALVLGAASPGGVCHHRALRVDRTARQRGAACRPDGRIWHGSRRTGLLRNPRRRARRHGRDGLSVRDYRGRHLMWAAHDASKPAKEAAQEIIVTAHRASRLEDEVPPGSGAAVLITSYTIVELPRLSNGRGPVNPGMAPEWPCAQSP